MKDSDKNTNSYNQMVLVPQQTLDEIKNDQKELFNLVKDMKLTSTPEGTVAKKFITESKAKEMLGKGTTWFYNQRKSGVLKAKKIGGTNYYNLDQIENMFNL